MAERVQVREIDDDEGRRLLRIIRGGTGSVVTWRRARTVCVSSTVAGRDGGSLTREDILLAVAMEADHSPMGPEVQAFVADGPLPDWDASEEEIGRRIEQLDAIPKPVTGEEARALVSCFGLDDCYGVAWTLLHLIETGPNPVLTTAPGPDANEWHQRLYDCAVFGGLIPRT